MYTLIVIYAISAGFGTTTIIDVYESKTACIEDALAATAELRAELPGEPTYAFCTPRN
jgi:hypothetical protein